MDKTVLMKNIKDYMISTWDMDLVGVAPVSAFDNEPDGYRPADILSCAKSVIVYGKRLLNGAVQAQYRRFEDGNERARSIYSTFGLELLPNWSMLFATFYLANYLETTYGATTQPLANGPEQNGYPYNTDLPLFAGPYKGGLPFNVDHAAVAAGLGQLSFSNFVVTKEFGPRIQFGCILTDLELEYDSPDTGKRICDPSVCHVCSDVCPMNALPDKTKTVEIAGIPYEVSDHKVNACTVAALGLRNEFSGVQKRGDLVAGNDPTDEDIAEAIKKYEISGNNLDHYPKSYCNKCQIYCPLGNRKEIFKEVSNY